MARLPFVPESQDQAWIDLYKTLLIVGSAWRPDSNPQRVCQVTEINGCYVNASWAASDEKQRATFMCSVGVFLREFSPVSQIKCVRPAALEVNGAILGARREATTLHKLAIQQRLKALASALNREKAKLVQRVEEILITEVDEQERRAVAALRPEIPRLFGAENT